MTKLFAYNNASASANALAKGLGIKKIKHTGSAYRPKPGDLIINWGSYSSSISSLVLDYTRVINHPTSVRTASDKLDTFDELFGVVQVPGFTTDMELVGEWLEEGCTVVVRHCLNGHSGAGIQLLTGEGTEVPEAPLYTKYIKKALEFRVHVVQGRVIDTQRKMRRSDVPDEAVNWQVRNFLNGFTYGRNDVLPDEARDEMAVLAVQALGLDFGAVDIIWNRERNQYYVLEVNTAPGLQGTTLERYIQAFREAGYV